VLGVPVVGAAEHEADDVIGSLSEQARTPVDIVTGDRDLFQLVDDARDVRVISTVKGMSRLEVLTDEVVVAKYGIRPDQYADFATLRGDASDGLPGVAGVGEKTAATLLAAHDDLAGIRAAAAAGVGMTKTQAAKVLAASDYLDVAPRVVAVVRDLELGEVDGAIAPLDEGSRTRAHELAERWGLGTSMTRAIAAFDA
jgi:5'-3' exonuclease